MDGWKTLEPCQGCISFGFLMWWTRREILVTAVVFCKRGLVIGHYCGWRVNKQQKHANTCLRNPAVSCRVAMVTPGPESLYLCCCFISSKCQRIDTCVCFMCMCVRVVLRSSFEENWTFFGEDILPCPVWGLWLGFREFSGSFNFRVITGSGSETWLGFLIKAWVIYYVQ